MRCVVLMFSPEQLDDAGLCMFVAVPMDANMCWHVDWRLCSTIPVHLFVDLSVTIPQLNVWNKLDSLDFQKLFRGQCLPVRLCASNSFKRTVIFMSLAVFSNREYMFTSNSSVPVYMKLTIGTTTSACRSFGMIRMSSLTLYRISSTLKKSVQALNTKRCTFNCELSLNCNVKSQ